MKVNGGGNRKVHHRPILMSSDGFEVKPEETLVEARSGSDVQIDRQIWV
ncbi:hypothetical protein Slin15195_G114380 [Septoria linicola]|uniref:Uncharacterized protein n=1 Tax=Septoria linicola TaxID=215465 RepID=A0A9Q9AZL0_9PEZI|nr:hypothetical protein Slin14017_G112720 [Septoria linicola]KAI5358992.1 hypothetical protein Slin14017_G112750 [Septoria linicola]USW58119.1 hypothetical protein Slin15195_G114380 [Septoria linicola]